MSSAQRLHCKQQIDIAKDLLSQLEELGFDYRRLDAKRAQRDAAEWAAEFLRDIEEENENRRRKVEMLRGRIAALQAELGTGS